MGSVNGTTEQLMRLELAPPEISNQTFEATLTQSVLRPTVLYMGRLILLQYITIKS